MLKILNSEPENFSSQAKQIYMSLGSYAEKELSRLDLFKEISEYDVLIVRLRNQIDKEIMDAGRNLKFIISATTGLDHVDTKYAAIKKIKILSLKGETDFLKTVPATAELTWGLIISLSRKIPFAFDSVKNGLWKRDQFRGHDLHGKRIGILGLGRIGEKIADFAKVFGMKVCAYDPYRKNWIKDVEKMNSIEELMKASDIFSINAALTDETEGLVGEKELSLLPQGALVINTARGEILDLRALLSELRSGHIAGAALDVIPEERNFNSSLRAELLDYAKSQSNLIITPHIGGASCESMEMTEIFMARKLADELSRLIQIRKEE